MKKNALSKTLIFIAIIATLTIFSCENDLGTFTKKTEIPEYYGNGVYYFSCEGQKFMESLSNFLEDGKEISTITSIRDQGGRKGYLVVVKNDNKKILNNHLVAN